MVTNISVVDEIAQLLQVIAQPARLQILLVLGSGEACVCHLEAVLGWRQAYISQHLMALRDAGLVSDQRAGRYIFYHVSDPALLKLVAQAAELRDVSLPDLGSPLDCSCPNCCSRRDT
jgi:DNA-binding transcriptional ArsR family regulator